MNMEEIEQRLLSLEARVRTLEGVPSSSRDDGGPSVGKSLKPVSIKEFLLEKSPQTANDRVVAIGYYLEVVSKQECFNAEDIRVCFRAAKVPAPKNVNDAINKNIAKGLMMESGDQKSPVKTWVLTTSGEKYVESGFGD